MFSFCHNGLVETDLLSAIDQVNTFLDLGSVLCLGLRVHRGSSSAGQLSRTELAAALTIQARRCDSLFRRGTGLLLLHEVPFSFELPMSVTTLTILLFRSRLVVESSLTFTESP